MAAAAAAAAIGSRRPLSTSFINFIIVDEDPELAEDSTLAPPIDYNNYIINIPIRNYERLLI